MHVGIKKAAELLGCHPRTVYNMINDGRLNGRKNFHGAWEIPLKDIEAILDAAAKKHEKVADLASGMGALEDFHATRMLEALELLAKAAEAVKAAYDAAVSRKVADVARTQELVDRIMQLDSCLQHYKNMAFVGAFMEDLQKETNRLLREADETWSRQVKYLHEVRDQLKGERVSQ